MWVGFYGVIDLLSVLPYYVELLLGQDISLPSRILHMFRLLRVFLHPPAAPHAASLGSFFVTIFMALIALSYFAKRGTWDEAMDTFINSDGDPIQFASIPVAAWFVIPLPAPLDPHPSAPSIPTSAPPPPITLSPAPWHCDLPSQQHHSSDVLRFTSPPQNADNVYAKLAPIAPPHPPITTVGYGEITPRSFLGRLITLPILVFGLLLITLPSFVLGREFSLVWAAMTEDKCLHPFSHVPCPSSPPSYDRPSRAQCFNDTHPSPNSTDDLPATYPPALQPLGTSSSTSRRPHTSTHPPSSSTSHPHHARASSYDPFLATPAPAPSTAIARDLTNLKLAQNQTELSRQIAELAEEVGRQGRLLGRLVGVLGEGVLGGSGRDGLKGRGKRREGLEEERYES
ncbi:hypothetical protein D9611_014616 [Ephemerocybe angulata]|uniref:Potassium channel domain-containing protein n=1 Tax=Ephemerocybe angulata TaxID=980116 RepID=A0A8H5CAR3_9AGAR|nr:hypothetical protein D9611_014616 [Tulosesus angulatus]